MKNSQHWIGLWLSRLGWVGIGLSLLVFAGVTVQPQTVSTTPVVYNLQAHLLFKLLPYIEWEGEEDSDPPFVICVIGKDPYGRVLDQLAEDSTYKNRKILIHRVENIDVENLEEDLRPCHILLVADGVQDRWEAIREKIKPWNTLTVSEYPNFTRLGGMIQFFIQADTLHLEVNIDVVEQAKIKISSQVLQLKKVRVIRN